jgi:hypothetical protein
MDTGSIITIVVAIIIIYFLIKYIISPILKLITGVITLLIAIYVLQHYFGFSFNQFLGPLAQYVNIDKWVGSFSWVIDSGISFITQLFSFLKFFSNNPSPS